MSVTQDNAAEDPQRAIAELRRRLDEREAERDAALAQNRDYAARQAASIEVLRTIAASPGDTAPVFTLIVQRARELCGATRASVTEYDGTLLHMRARDGYDPTTATLGDRDWPRAPGPDTIHGRTVLRGDVVHIRDVDTDTEYGPTSREIMRRLGSRSLLGVPLLRQGQPVGVISLGRPISGGFDTEDIEVVRSFAAQAVIAIDNARLLAEQREALEQQTATAEVLQVINASPGSLTPVFDTLLQKVLDLCETPSGALIIFDGDMNRVPAMRGMAPAAEAFLRIPFKSIPGSPTDRVRRGSDVVHVEDITTETGWAGNQQRQVTASLGNIRTSLWIALRNDVTCLGALYFYRTEVRPFTDKQIALLKNFAAQAVIAMENARLLGELRQRTDDLQESLEYQIATSDVLKAMSASPGDPQPVFDLIADRAREICGAYGVTVFEFDGALIHRHAATGVSEDPAEREAAKAGYPMSPTRDRLAGRAILDREIVHVRDHRTEPGLLWLPHYNTALSSVTVPMLRDGEPIGALSMGSRNAGGFTDVQVELLETFAEQAVIAITSAEVHREQREALERQTATAEVLQVINASPGNLAPVFDAILEKALHICQPAFGTLRALDGERMTLLAERGTNAALAAWRATYPEEQFSPNLMRMIETRRPVHLPDIREGESYRSGHPAPRAVADLGGARTFLLVPLLKEGTVVGTLQIYRQEVRAFTDNEISLLENFAAQAVIAMENARLLGELRDTTVDLRQSLEYQTAISDVLKVISRSTFDLQPVLQTLLSAAARLCDAENGGIATVEGDGVRVAAHYSPDGSFRASSLGQLLPLNRATIVGRTVLEGRVVHVEDVAADPEHVNPALELQGLHSTMLGVPLLRDGVAIGSIRLARNGVRPFTDRQIELVRTFADQAVIAIENTRLITETREALEQQTAMADVLEVINASPGNLTPVFQTMLDNVLRLCGATFGELRRIDGDVSTTLATSGMPPAYQRVRFGSQLNTRSGAASRRFLLGEHVVHIADLMDTEEYRGGEPMRRAVVDDGGMRALLTVPLRKDDTLLGLIAIFRREPGAFTEKQIALLENFAAQAVIAMENARLLAEQRDALERRTAMAEVLAIINASPGNLAPVFDAILDAVLRLSDSAFGSVCTFDGEIVHSAATRGYEPNFRATKPEPGTLTHRVVIGGEDMVWLPDIRDDDAYRAGNPVRVQIVDRSGARTQLIAALRKDGKPVGLINIFRTEVKPFTDSQIALVKAFAAQAVIAMENARLLGELRDARDAAEASLIELKIAQANLIQAEKMASLGQLTAGIAHEIKNPLNFVNNFAALSVDLLEELKETAAPGFAALTDDQRADIDDVSAMLTTNLQKITEHGKRADGIVKAMLEHSRGSSGERREVDLNALVDEALNLAYHGARAQDQSFNITLERDYATDLAPIEVNPQDLTRVFLNMFSNGFYAANKRARESGGNEPALRVATRATGDAVEIRIRDNGTGIPPDIRDKLFQPFFTTKPTGEGTGLGLSITYDIVTKQHGGTIKVDSEPGVFTEFTVTLPRRMFAAEGSQP